MILLTRLHNLMRSYVDDGRLPWPDPKTIVLFAIWESR